MTATESHYNRIGGAPVVRGIVDELFREAMARPLLALAVADVRAGHVEALLTDALGGPGNGEDPARLSLNMQPADFADFTAHVRHVLRLADAPAATVAAVMAAVEGWNRQ